MTVLSGSVLQHAVVAFLLFMQHYDSSGSVRCNTLASFGWHLTARRFALPDRRQENMARRAAGEDELSEDVPAQFKPPPEPSQLDYFLIANQISNYCDQVRRCVMCTHTDRMQETCAGSLSSRSAGGSFECAQIRRRVSVFSCVGSRHYASVIFKSCMTSLRVRCAGQQHRRAGTAEAVPHGEPAESPRFVSSVPHESWLASGAVG